MTITAVYLAISLLRSEVSRFLPVTDSAPSCFKFTSLGSLHKCHFLRRPSLKSQPGACILYPHLCLIFFPPVTFHCTSPSNI